MARSPTKYYFSLGQEVNGLKIIEYTKDKYYHKCYLVQSLTYPDAPFYKISESALKRGVKDGYITGHRQYEGNSLYSVDRLKPYLVDTEQAKKISKQSKELIFVKCLECERIRKIRADILFLKGLSCYFCSKNTPYPELFMLAYLETKNIKYEYQKILKDLPNEHIDFYIYIDSNEYIIETNGNHHYKSGNGFMKHKETIESDKAKRKYAKNNNIVMIELNCKVSSFEYIKNSIEKCSFLPNVSEKEKQKIIKIMMGNKRYPIEEMIDMYNKGYNIKELGTKYNMSPSNIWTILKKFDVELRHNKK